MSSFKKMIFENIPVNQQSGKTDKAKSERLELSAVEKGIARKLETLPVRKMYRHNLADILLVWRGLKPATDVVIGREWEIPKLQEAKSKELRDIKTIFESAGLVTLEGDNETGKIEDEHGQPQYGYTQRRYFVAPDKETAQKLKFAYKQDDSKIFGKLSGYPQSAVDAYIQTEESMEEKLLDPTDLPEDLRNKDFMAFAQYRLSKESWQAELKIAERWAEEIKRVAPQLYQEIVNDYRAMLETGPHQEKPETTGEKLRPIKIITEQGSVYKYLPDGRTQRFKTVTGELLEPQDILVFIPPWDLIKDQAVKLHPEIFKGIENQTQYEQLLLEYAQREDKTIRVIDGNGKELTSGSEAVGVKRIFIALVDKANSKNSFSLPVAKKPKIGYLTMDTRKFQDEDGKTYRERHIGNKVKEIKYAAKLTPDRDA